MATGSFAQAYNLAMTGIFPPATAATLRQRVAVAVCDYALSVVASEASAVTGHAARMTLATSAVTEPDTVAQKFLLGVIQYLSDQNVAFPPTDANLTTAVTALWNVVAGVG